MNDDARPSLPAPAGVTVEAAPGQRDHTDTQRSLQQASAALEAAYRRIRQVRRNLLEVTDRMPTPESPSYPFELNDFGPEHNAIVLTGPSADDSTNVDGGNFGRSLAITAPPNMRATGRFGDLPPLNTTGMVNPTLPNVQDSPYLSHRPYLLPRRSQLDSQLARRREAQMDDASTSLGRRVAAREAAGASNPGPHSTLNSLSRFDGNSSQLLASIERDIAHFRMIAQQRRMEAALAATPDSATAPASTRPNSTPDAGASRRPSQAQNASTGPNTGLLGLHPESRRRRLTGGIYSARASASTHSERLSLLSNFSVQNLPTPVSANPRPLIFEEPSSYIQVADFTRSESRHDWEDDIEEHDQRNYVIRRRLNADGEEHVHPINLEWIHEAPYGSTVLNGRRATGQNGGTSGGPQRRRGWARLDPDGNEIPSDEEEELERVRTEYRVWAQSRPRAPVFTRDRVASHPGFHSLQAATTSTSLSPDEDTGPPDGVPRVRLSARDHQPHYGSVMDSVITVDSVRKEQTLPGPPFLAPFPPNPLPMPVEEMVWSPPKRKTPRVVTIPRHASLAGR
ncbi:hypothetical protein LshimejAT787_0308310 [Lyophyllum shimeji]|uniref:Uncharacterized protein n=1 Tax=Lyophyllum shimeji TaxID=47721 RepID=A0A9P3PJE3_LYOSH|nr:hypothetical protein LshimejAT787_0308310 [Lyophyllum shimeji]